MLENRAVSEAKSVATVLIHLYDVASQLKYDDIIDSFAAAKARKVKL